MTRGSFGAIRHAHKPHAAARPGRQDLWHATPFGVWLWFKALVQYLMSARLVQFACWCGAQQEVSQLMLQQDVSQLVS